MKAYTYSIYHITSKRYYYGVRKSTYFDLGTQYFSSSKLVARLIEEHGLNEFVFKLRRKFESYEEARYHETKFLQRIKAVKNPKMLNQAISAKHVPSKDSESEKIRRAKISSTMKKLWNDDEYRANQNFICKDPIEVSARGMKGALQRAQNYKLGIRTRKLRVKKPYKDIILSKGDLTKTVKANQVPQYRKSGWERLDRQEAL